MGFTPDTNKTRKLWHFVMLTALTLGWHDMFCHAIYGLRLLRGRAPCCLVAEPLEWLWIHELFLWFLLALVLLPAAVVHYFQRLNSPSLFSLGSLSCALRLLSSSWGSYFLLAEVGWYTLLFFMVGLFWFLVSLLSCKDRTDVAVNSTIARVDLFISSFSCLTRKALFWLSQFDLLLYAESELSG